MFSRWLTLFVSPLNHTTSSVYNSVCMIHVLLRALWRLFIFFIGVLLVWLTIFKVAPYADVRLPVFIVLLLVYAVFAYIIIPTLIRILRLFDKPNHIPLYAVTPDGWPSDPVNIAIVASSREQLIASMERAGWHVADEPTFRNNLKAFYSMIFNQPYPTMPFSKLYLFGRPFDIGFQKPLDGSTSPRSRHHVRFWQLEVPHDEKHFSNFEFWHKKVRHLLGREKQIWIGTAIKDTNIFGIRWRSGSFTHQISVDVEAERDLIINDLSEARQLRSVDVISAGKPFSFRGQTINRGGPLICDGTLSVVEIRGPIKSVVLGHIPKK